MSRQTDELLLHIPTEQEVKQLVPPEEIGRAKERLRLLMDLQRHAGFKLFADGIAIEAKAQMLEMDRTDNPTVLAKAAGRLYALDMVSHYIDRETTRLTQLLQAIGAA